MIILKLWKVHFLVTIGTTIMQIRQQIAKTIKIFSLQFLQNIIFSNSPAFYLNWLAWSFNVYDFFSKSYNWTWLSSIFLVLSVTAPLNLYGYKIFTSSRFSLAIATLSKFFKFSYFRQIFCIYGLACSFNDDYI